MTSPSSSPHTSSSSAPLPPPASAAGAADPTVPDSAPTATADTPRRRLIRVLIGLAPIILFVASYFVLDPFKILYYYSSFYPKRSQFTSLNRDFVGTELFTRQRAAQHYDALILGNSRSLAYTTAAWKRHLPASASAFHYDASVESLYGIARKFRYAERLGAVPRHCLLILDTSLLEDTANTPGYLYRKDYRISGESWWAYQLLGARNYLTTGYSLAYLRRQLTGYSDPTYFLPYRVKADSLTNDYILASVDSTIAVDSVGYYRRRRSEFYVRHPQTAAPVIGPAQRALLAEIQGIVQRHHTLMRVVVSPLYNQLKMADADVAALRATFGPARVFDFSGVNAYTSTYANYYETSHYRPFIANQVLKEIYR